MLNGATSVLCAMVRTQTKFFIFYGCIQLVFHIFLDFGGFTIVRSMSRGQVMVSKSGDQPIFIGFGIRSQEKNIVDQSFFPLPFMCAVLDFNFVNGNWMEIKKNLSGRASNANQCCEIFSTSKRDMKVNKYNPKIGSIMRVKTKSEHLEVTTPLFIQQFSILDKNATKNDDVDFFKRIVLEGLDILNGLPAWLEPTVTKDIEQWIPFKTDSLLLLDKFEGPDFDFGLVLYEKKRLWVSLRSLSVISEAS
jgi:hypothetical protein